jgi:hypothetical protein
MLFGAEDDTGLLSLRLDESGLLSTNVADAVFPLGAILENEYLDSRKVHKMLPNYRGSKETA